MDSTVITALIAFGGVLLSILGSTVGTYFLNKKLNKANNEVQKEISNRNIDANLVAKARIEWIHETREISADIISITSKIQRNINTYMDQKKIEAQLLVKKDYKNHKIISDDALQTYNRYQDDLDTLFFKVNLFKLNLGKNEVNDAFVEQAELLLDMFIQETHLIQEYIYGKKSIAESFGLVKSTSINLSDELKKYIDLSRIYYKEEWTKAKHGK